MLNNSLLQRRKIVACEDPTLKGPCWCYTRYKNRNGYGKLRYQGKLWLAHRLAYFLKKGPIPENLEIDHLCSVRSCFNPDHLEATTHLINSLRGIGGINRYKETCKNGHKFDDENTIYKFRDGKLRQRQCVICKRKYDKKYRHKKLNERR